MYITVSIHLAVIIVLLAARIGFEVQRENSFVMDFTAQEAAEKLQERLRMQERIEAQLEQMISDRSDQNQWVKTMLEKDLCGEISK